MQITEFTRTLSKFSGNRKIITIPEALEDIVEKYTGQKLKVTLSTLDED